jgi:hypothetical protein
MQRRPIPNEDGRSIVPGERRVVRVTKSLWTISRRDFFKATGLVGASSMLGTGCDPLIPELVPSFETTLVRPEDLLFLRFEFANLARVAASGGGEELVQQGFVTGYIIVHFQAQHIFEEVLEETNKPAVDPQPLDARIAGGSRIVLKVPAGSPPIPFTGEGLLEALGRLEMSVAPHARPPSAISGPVVSIPDTGPIITVPNASDVRTITTARDQRRLQRINAAADDVVVAPNPGDITPIPQDQLPVAPREPVNGETALEVPYRLILSPNRHGGWTHNTSKEQGKKQGRYELWHTRLGVRSAASGAVSEAASFNRTVRAIWTRDQLFDPEDPYTYDDYNPPNPPLPPGSYDDVFPGTAFERTMEPAHRVQIVHQSSNFSQPWNGPNYTPRPIKVNRLMLSTLGAWLDSTVDFTDASPLNVVVWDHQASMGRDYYVKIVEKGELIWGIPTVKVTITARRFLSPYQDTAFLWQYTEFRVTEPFRAFPDDHKFPFKSLTCKTLVTPKVDSVPDGSCKIKVNNQPFLFKFQAIDMGNNPIDLALPATWAPIQGSVVLHADAQHAIDLFNESDFDAARTIPLNGQRIAFAPNNKKDDTTYETVDITVNSELSTNNDVAVPFRPLLEQTKINVEAIRHLLGQGGATAFTYHPAYVSGGFQSGNPGEALFKLASGSLKADFSKKSDSSGGFVDPSLNVSAIGRKTGLISGNSDTVATTNQFNPGDFLPDAFIFGVVPLKDILLGGGLDAAPNFVTKTVDAVTGFLEDALELKNLLLNANAQLDFDSSQLANQLQAAIDAIGAIPAPDAGNFQTLLGTAQTAVGQVQSFAQALIDDPLTGSLLIAEKQELKRRARSVRDVLGAVSAGLKAFATGVDLAKNLTVRLEWRSPLQPDGAKFFVPKSGGGFMIGVEARAKQVGDKPPGVDVVAGIEKFDVNVFGDAAKLVTIPFKHLLFKVESGRKPEVDVQFEEGGVGFDGILAFIETLSKLIPGAGFSDPPALEVDSEGIRASFSVPIPSIAVGVFAMQNMRLSAGFEVPFIGNPLSVSFAFCTREEPFVLTIMMIGGGGFVGLTLSPRGMLLLEAALEARAQLAVDFGVASGSISIAAGVYFRLEVQGGEEKGSLTGYLRFQGKVDVLGLISASITLLLELIYEFSSGKLVGRATLTIEVSIAFFSFSVEVTAERKLAGSNDDPTFAQQMGTYTLDEGTPEEVTVDPWAEYTGAFILAAA